MRRAGPQPTQLIGCIEPPVGTLYRRTGGQGLVPRCITKDGWFGERAIPCRWRIPKAPDGVLRRRLESSAGFPRCHRQGESLATARRASEHPLIARTRHSRKEGAIDV